MFACFSLDLARFEHTCSLRRCYGSVYAHEHAQIERSRRENSANWCNFRVKQIRQQYYFLAATRKSTFCRQFFPPILLRSQTKLNAVFFNHELTVGDSYET